MLNTYIITSYLQHVSVSVTPSSVRALHYLLKSYKHVAMLLYNLQHKKQDILYILQQHCKKHIFLNSNATVSLKMV